MFPPLPVLLAQADAPMPALQAWIGQDQDPAPFIAFAQARRRDLGAAAREPHRTWLIRLMTGKDESLRDWAATRLVEASAVLPKDLPSPNGYLLDACVERFKRRVLYGNLAQERRKDVREDPPKPWSDLGEVAEVDDRAPCWGPWRAKLAETKRPAVTLGFYGLFAPHLRTQDGPWVRNAFIAAAEHPIDEPWKSLAFLLGTDWLMLYGEDRDWQALREACTTKPWRYALADLQEDVRRLPLFRVDAPPRPRTKGAWQPPRLRRTTFLQPDYPRKASSLGFSTDTSVVVDLDPEGRAVALGLAPGYALGLFGPSAIRWASKWSYEPATVDGQPVASRLYGGVQFVYRRF